MLALEPLVVAQLRSVLADGWKVMGFTADAGKRDGFPLASVFFADGNVADSKTGAANVQTAWRVTLVTRRGDEAAALLDTAFAASMGGLHNWSPGAVGGHHWSRLALLQVAPPQYTEDGLAGIELTFTTSARYDGHPS